MELTEKTLGKTEIFNGRIIKVSVDDIELPNGDKAIRELVEHPGGVGIVAINENEEIFVVKQFRYPYKEVTLEIPAGKLEKGQNPLENGKRELKEETGAEGYSYVSLGKVYPTPGYCSEIIHMYMCKVQTQGEQNLDKDEFLNVEKIKLKDALEMVLNNQIPDAKTQIGILKAAALLQKAAENN